MAADIVLEVEDDDLLELEVDDDVGVEWAEDEYIPMHSSEYPDYEGAYEADALFSEQVFATRRRVMTDDFTVHAINYTEAPNDYGTTVTIGG